MKRSYKIVGYLAYEGEYVSEKITIKPGFKTEGEAYDWLDSHREYERDLESAREEGGYAYCWLDVVDSLTAIEL